MVRQGDRPSVDEGVEIGPNPAALPDRPWFTGHLGFAHGPGFTTPRGPVDAELARAGWPSLSSVSPEYQIRYGLAVYDVALDIRLAWSDERFADRANTATVLEHHRVAFGVDLGYRLWLGRMFSLSPSVGLGKRWSMLCFEGSPGASAWTARSPFAKILRNPARDACLDAAAATLDVGLALAWNLRLGQVDEGATRLGGYVSLGPRVGYSLALSSGRTWRSAPEEPGANPDAELARVEGPAAPLGGAFLGIELQLRFTAEERR
jgi:hypothetical protein